MSEGSPPPEWRPIEDNLESGNQSMMVAEGWKDAVLRWLQAWLGVGVGLGVGLGFSPCCAGCRPGHIGMHGHYYNTCTACAPHPAPCTLHPWQAKSLTAEAVHAMSLDPHRALELELVASCYRMLYYLCWDHTDNWQPFSNGTTLRFLFAQMGELAGVYVRGEPLNWWARSNPDPNPNPNPNPKP